LALFQPVLCFVGPSHNCALPCCLVFHHIRWPLVQPVQPWWQVRG
jgi:hypothetical protein